MVFNSFSFALFFLIVFLFYYWLPTNTRYIWLSFASFFFCCFTDYRFGVILFISVVFTFFSGLVLEKMQSQAIANCVIISNFVILLIALLLFKIEPIKSLIIPLGFSFYSLQAYGYLHDVYSKKIEAEHNFFKCALFISFFPTLISGPIERSTNLLSQIRTDVSFDYCKARKGILTISLGLFQKQILANQLGAIVDTIFSHYSDMQGFSLLFAVFLYSLQLYFDFAGYSNIAIGCSQMLGFDLANNFRQPYFASSIKDFWSRWHISLSSWLRDYIYIPLGGNKKGIFRKNINLTATFILSSLWHGLGTNFLIWGLMHSFFQILESNTNKLHAKFNNSFWGRITNILVTYVAVCLAWIFFRSKSIKEACTIIKRIITEFKIKDALFYGSYLGQFTKVHVLLLMCGVLLMFLVDILHEKDIHVSDLLRKAPFMTRWFLYIGYGLFMILISLRAYGVYASNFIYAGF